VVSVFDERKHLIGRLGKPKQATLPLRTTRQKPGRLFKSVHADIINVVNSGELAAYARLAIWCLTACLRDDLFGASTSMRSATLQVLQFAAAALQRS
jgi:hypothetical protein